MQPITAHYPTRQTGSAFTRQAPPSTAKPTSRRRHTEPKKRFSVTNQPQQIRLPSNTGPLQPSTIQYTPIQTRLSTTDRAFDHSSIRYWPVGGGGSGLVSAFLTPLRRLRQSDPAGGGEGGGKRDVASGPSFARCSSATPGRGLLRQDLIWSNLESKGDGRRRIFPRDLWGIESFSRFGSSYSILEEGKKDTQFIYPSNLRFEPVPFS
ncbi:predicted protein [Histoplasma mississippiense (nom. inval.)]|uniref:predicted protein n=1 Tax=Ajellomyces capsulatus (strain NAm1 / WU24) TaxID=2059318 RepID=UPI000157BA0F|nr:predicted protein [Histoplasma mississippiense (nom. inval.)]EDN03829.1 predicted protein [Histoplasma mississippiense (nom. inval.)]